MSLHGRIKLSAQEFVCEANINFCGGEKRKAHLFTVNRNEIYTGFYKAFHLGFDD